MLMGLCASLHRPHAIGKPLKAQTQHRLAHQVTVARQAAVPGLQCRFEYAAPWGGPVALIEDALRLPALGPAAAACRTVLCALPQPG